MASSHLGRIALACAAVFGFVAVVMACDDGGHRDDFSGRGGPRCAQTVRQCREVCAYDCDRYQCYPECGEECWDQCASNGGEAIDASIDGALVTDGGILVPSDAAAPDAGSGTGVLCSDCVSNDECETGALCILRGGPPRTDDAGDDDSGAPVGRGFCGHACTQDDCPQGFLCSQIGASRQCLPIGNACP